MSSQFIEINSYSAVLYRGGKMVEAHAGSSSSIQAWVNAQRLGKDKEIGVRGWHNLTILRNSEKEPTNAI